MQFLRALQQMGARVDGEKQKAPLDLFLEGRGIVQTHANPTALTLQSVTFSPDSGLCGVTAGAGLSVPASLSCF